MRQIQKKEQTALLAWFQKNKRPLPWRKNQDPYRIWISEVMLQQTTCVAVIPYYQNFIKTFPRLKDLAKAEEKTLFSLWSGLGYYTRASHLLKSAQKINQLRTFPCAYKELLKFPGFGAYTARAVSSLSFDEPVGVLDGNVIRFLSRFHGLPLKWWTSASRLFLQNLADRWTHHQKSSQINQALMELGSLVCTPQKPTCFLCPLQKDCVAFKTKKVALLPLKRIKKTCEIWHWKPYKIQNKNKFAFVENNYLPFLKKKMIFPGTVKKTKKRPKHYHFNHHIMHYKIYVTVQSRSSLRTSSFHWLSPKQIAERSPSSLIQKIIRTS